MTNEELKAKIANLNSIEEAYNLSKECGYTGTMEEFKAQCDNAAASNEQMDMDAMDSVAGGLGIGMQEAWSWFLKPAVQNLGDKLLDSMDEIVDNYGDKVLDTVNKIVKDPINEIKNLVNG